ncbi:MAG TPA: hypothetical protein VNU95_13750 [Candidatus Acidoferrales bacterium]|nr:hypothetical protein [Candidatus Acidoferrales bacterium]
MKLSDFTGAFVLSAISFGIAVFFIYMAYVGMVTGTALKTKPYPHSVPHARGASQYAGVFTRDENPRQFWFAETLYATAAVFFLIAGVQMIRQEYKEQMERQKPASPPHHKIN